MHAGGRLPLLHAHRDGRPGGGQLPDDARGAAHGSARRLVAQGVRARLNVNDTTPAVDAPGPRELRRFGALLGGFFGVLPALVRHHFHVWPWLAAAVLWGAALSYPPALRYLHAGWAKLGRALGQLNTRIVLTLLFVAVLAPMGIVMRLFGRDRMERRFEPGRESYRRP